MRLSRTFLVIAAATVLVVGLLVTFVARESGSEPYQAPQADLAHWAIAAGEPDDAWVVAARPPDVLVASLFRQISRHTSAHLLPVPHAALPLALRAEYEDSLQGVYGVDSIIRMARDADVERAAFEPICIGRREDTTPGHAGTLYFLAVDAKEFWQLRTNLAPDQPEHAGTGVYDAGALSPILPIAMTDADIDRWWPFTLDQSSDCIAPLTLR